MNQTFVIPKQSNKQSERRQSKQLFICISEQLNMISSKSNLWKNIGKEDTVKQYQSSHSSSSRPVKTFHIMFQDDNPSKSDGQSLSQFKKNEEQFISQENHSSSIKGFDDNEGSPMIITVDNGDNKQQNEQVLQVVSFESQQQRGHHQMNQILSGFKELQENNQKGKNKQSSSFQLPAFNTSYGKQRHFQITAIVGVLRNIRELKDRISKHKRQSLNEILKCRNQSINYFLSMKQALITRQKSTTTIQSFTKLDQLKFSQQMNRKYSTLQQQVQTLNQTLSFERQAQEVAKREKREMQQKLKKAQRTQKEQRNKLGSEQAMMEDMKLRINRLQLQLKQARLQCENSSARVPKLKQVIKEREVLINSRNNQISELEKKIKSMIITLEDKSSKEHRLDLELKSLKERLQKEGSANEKELSKYKAQISKLKTLLKTSEEQLSNCEEYINNINFELKEQQNQNLKMRQKTKQAQLVFHKKLQEYESYLIQLQTNITHMSLAQQQKQQELANKEDQLNRIKQDFENKLMEIKAKQYELQQIKKQIDFKVMSLERRQDGLKAEYKMIIQNQNAVKDKWYERYYTMFSPEKQKRYQSPQIYSPAQRDINPISIHSSFNRIDQVDLQKLEVRSNREKLYQVKSEKNISLTPNIFYRSDVKTSRNDRELTSSPAQLTGLGSRINNLRRELTRELGQISKH